MKTLFKLSIFNNRDATAKKLIFGEIVKTSVF